LRHLVPHGAGEFALLELARLKLPSEKIFKHFHLPLEATLARRNSIHKIALKSERLRLQISVSNLIAFKHARQCYPVGRHETSLDKLVALPVSIKNGAIFELLYSFSLATRHVLTQNISLIAVQILCLDQRACIALQRCRLVFASWIQFVPGGSHCGIFRLTDTLGCRQRVGREGERDQKLLDLVSLGLLDW
jgi:hypothetical protein